MKRILFLVLIIYLTTSCQKENNYFDEKENPEELVTRLQDEYGLKITLLKDNVDSLPIIPYEKFIQYQNFLKENPTTVFDMESSDSRVVTDWVCMRQSYGILLTNNMRIPYTGLSVRIDIKIPNSMKIGMNIISSTGEIFVKSHASYIQRELQNGEIVCVVGDIEGYVAYLVPLYSDSEYIGMLVQQFTRATFDIWGYKNFSVDFTVGEPM